MTATTVDHQHAPCLPSLHAGPLQRGEERVGVDRLGEKVVDGETRDDPFFRDDGDDHDGHVAVRSRGADPLEHILAAHVGQQQIERDGVESPRFAERERLRAVAGGLDGVARIGQRPDQDRMVLGVVLDDQHRGSAGARLLARPAQRRSPDCALPRQHGMKHAALSHRAPHCDPAALRLGQPAREGQPEAGAGVLFGGPGIELLKFDEQLLDVRRRDAGSVVLDLQAEMRGALRSRADLDAAAERRELEGVGKEIVDDLLEPRGIEEDPLLQGRIDADRRLDPLRDGEGADDAGDLADGLLQPRTSLISCSR